MAPAKYDQNVMTLIDDSHSECFLIQFCFPSEYLACQQPSSGHVAPIAAAICSESAFSVPERFFADFVIVNPSRRRRKQYRSKRDVERHGFECSWNLASRHARQDHFNILDRTVCTRIIEKLPGSYTTNSSEHLRFSHKINYQSVSVIWTSSTEA